MVVVFVDDDDDDVVDDVDDDVTPLIQKMDETHDKLINSGGWTSRNILLAVLFCQICAQNIMKPIFRSYVSFRMCTGCFLGFFRKGQ